MARSILPLLFCIAASAAEIDLDATAKRIVTDVARIKPGEVVAVAAGKHAIPLLESVMIEAAMAGGMPVTFVTTDRIEREIMLRVPEKYLEQEPSFLLNWYNDVDVQINLPYIEDAKAVYAGVSETRQAIYNKVMQSMNQAIGESPVRIVNVMYPSREFAENRHVDFSMIEKMEWAAIGADYPQIARDADRLRAQLPGATVRVTTQSGTDFEFTIGDRKIFTFDGIITEEEAKSKNILDRLVALPGGMATVAPIETSANGKVVIPRTLCDFEPMTNVSFEFRDGKLQNFEAAEGAQCFEKTMAAYQGPKDMFGSFMIGLNPELRVIENPGDYRPAAAAGMVMFGVGENRLLGGKNDSAGGQFSFPLVNATVEVDGRKVVENGKLIQ